MALNYKIHLLWGFLLAIVACTGNELFPDENYNGNKSTNSQNIQRSEEEALHIANTFFQERKDLTRSTTKSLFSAEARTLAPQVKVRSGQSYPAVDTTMYFINRGDNNGFLLVSGDKRHPAIIAYSNKGSLHLKDIRSSSPMSHYVEQYEKYISFEHDSATLAYDKEMRKRWGDKWKFKLIPLHPDSMKVPGAPTLEHDYPKTSRITFSPFEKEINWGQKYPYNITFTPIRDTTPPVGCAVIAMAQVLALYKQPQAVGDLQLHWDNIYNECANLKTLADTFYVKNKKLPPVSENNRLAILEVSSLCKKISKIAGTRYTTTAGSTYPEYMPPTMRKLGFSCSNLHPIEGKELVNELNNHRPVIITATGIVDTISNRRVGHGWIIDGYEIVTVEEHITHTATYLKLRISDNYYFRCNWGWNGGGLTAPNGSAYFSLDHLIPWVKTPQEKWYIPAYFDSILFGCTNIKYEKNE